MRRLLFAVFLCVVISIPDGALSQSGGMEPEINMFCPETVGFGELLGLLSTMTLGGNGNEFAMTWSFETSELMEVWVECFTGSCQRYAQENNYYINMTQSEGDGTTTTWTSTLLIDSATFDMSGRWVAEWTVADIPYGYTCDVAIVPLVADQGKPPEPILLKRVTTLNTADLIFEVAESLEDLSRMLDRQVISFFFLEVFLDDEPVLVGKEAASGLTPEGKASITYYVLDLKPSTMYVGRLTAVGSGGNASTTFNFQTSSLGGKLEAPFIYSPQPSIVLVNEEVKLNCSSNENGVNFQWFHNESRLEGEDGMVLERAVSQDTSGPYRCRISVPTQFETSNTHTLIVVQRDQIYTSTGSAEITVNLEYNDYLKDSSTFYYQAMDIYFELLIRDAMLGRRNFLRSIRSRFRAGSVIADVFLLERVLLTDQSEGLNAGSYLKDALASGVAENFQPNQIFKLALDGIYYVSDEIINRMIIEDDSAAIHCKFTITSSTVPDFDIVWTFNGAVIDQARSTTFKFSKTSQEVKWPALEPLRIYRYTYMLTIQNFLLRLTGTYRCEIRMNTILPAQLLYDGEYYQEKTISAQIVLQKPKVTISPQSVVLESDVVRITCNYDQQGVRDVNVMTDKEKVVESQIRNGRAYKITLLPDVKWVYCLASTSFGTSKSGNCHIYRIIKDAVSCQANKDNRGLLWEKSPVGIITKSCPQDYSGIVTRTCLQSGEWKDSNYIDCSKKELEDVKKTIEIINNDGIQPTQSKITDISESLNTTISESGTELYSGDIVQVVNILDEVSQAIEIVADVKDKETNLVDTIALENFADSADSILSVDDSQWEEVINTAKSDIGSKLVVAMDKIAVSSLKANTSGAIVKKNLAIQRDSAQLKDIDFPDLTDANYKNYDEWVVKSKNRLHLSAKNFPGEQVRYSAVLFNSLHSKFAVNSEAQKRYKVGRKFKDMELSSDIISLSLSKDIPKFTSPLDLDIQITKENYSNPVCGYLDTTLGDIPIWSSKGCQTIDVDEDVVSCHCDHLTNFAVLMSPYKTDDDEHHEILSIVTYVGCGISILCLIITIIMHAITWKYVKDTRSILHLNLSVILILAYTAFMAGIDRTEDDTVCTAVTIVLHFLFLTVFSIMLVEGVQIFVSVTFVFSTNIHLSALIFLAYFCPMVIVGITYGVTHDGGYREDDFCWLKIDSGTLWAFVGPALFVILVNLIVMCLTLRAMLNTVTMKQKDTRAKTKSAMRAVCVLSPIFGITWVFGVFALNNSLVAFQYLFAIFNTLQGFLVFLFYCLLNNQIKDGLRHMLRKHRQRSFGTGETMYGTRSKGVDTSSGARQNVDSSSFSETAPKTESSPVSNDNAFDAVFPFPNSTPRNKAVINPVFIHEDGN